MQAFYKLLKNLKMFCLNGGAEGDRTPDLRNAIATLSQLSYGPTVSAHLGDVRPSATPNMS